MNAAASIALASLALTAATGLASAQQVISARAGLVNNIEGQVLVDGKQLAPKPTEFPQLKAGALLETQDGRAEILLSPGAFLRLGENSAIRLTSDQLTDPRFEFVSGQVLVECGYLEPGEAINIAANGATITLAKTGNYQIGGDPAVIKVYDGEARVERDGQVQVVKRARLLALSGAGEPEKFDASRGDSLYRWARRRSGYLAVANHSAARSLMREQNRLRIGARAWIFDAYYGMYTFLPSSGYYRNAFGLTFFSPRAYYESVYLRPTAPVYGGGGSVGAGGAGGYTARAGTSSGMSGTAAAAGRSAPTTSAGAASGAASAGRQSGSAGGRGR